jgi:putative ABC transport system permease protein
VSAVGSVVRAGIARRRVQTVVIGLAAMMAVTASVLGGSLLVASRAPFDHAFARQRGAHLVAQFQGSAAQQAAASAHSPGVTAAAGPFPTVSAYPAPASEAGTGVQGRAAGAQDQPAGVRMPPLRTVGRASAGGPVDDISLLSGHWAAAPGQIVVSPDYNGPDLSVGTVLRFPEAAGAPTLTVVGVARSVSRTADAWVLPSQISALTAPGTADGLQMLYRFSSAGTAAAVAADRSAIAAAVPADAVAGWQSWLDVKRSSDTSTALYVPFLTAFGLLGVAMSVLIVGNVVAGAVGTGTRRIGVLKAIGFTPAEVVRAYMGQALIPAAAGTVLGTVLGDLFAGTVLAQTEQVYGTTGLAVAPWVDAAAIAGTLALVTATAFVSALRAGRMRTVEALAVGRTPQAGRGHRAARIAARLPLPRPITLGLARPFARPARAAAMVVAIVFGTAAVTFATGLSTSLQRIQDAKDPRGSAVTVFAAPPPGMTAPGAGGPPSAPGSGNPGSGAPSASSASNAGKQITAVPGDTAAMALAIGAQPGTRAFYGTTHTVVSAAGSSGSIAVTGFIGDASWAGYQLVSGTWFHGPGEAVVPKPFLTATGTHVGDTVILSDHGKDLRVRISGESFTTQNSGMVLFTDAATLTPAEPGLKADLFSIALTPGTDAGAYASALTATLRPTGALAVADSGGGASTLLIMLDVLTVLLTLMLTLVAGLGVLNTVVLDTKDRVRDLGVAKALGMTPRQAVAMVLASIVVVGVIGGTVGVPLGTALQRIVVPAMGNTAGIDLPARIVDAYGPTELVALGLGGLLIAVLAALMPAGWAARTRTAVALRAE